MIVRTDKQKWVLDKGIKTIVPTRLNHMTMAHNHLMELNWWPQRGDMIFYNGYRNIILEVEVPPEVYWQQTNVWMGLVCHCEVAVEGDAKPLVDASQVAPTEVSTQADALAAQKPEIAIKTAE